MGGGNPELGMMMAQYNRQEVLRSLQRYRDAITATIEQIESEDWQAIAQQLKTTQAARPSFVSE